MLCGRLSSVVGRVTVSVLVPAGIVRVISSTPKWMWFGGVVMPRVGSFRSSAVTRYLTRVSLSLTSRLLVVEPLWVTVNETGSPSFTQSWSPLTDTRGLTPSLSWISKVWVLGQPAR